MPPPVNEAQPSSQWTGTYLVSLQAYFLEGSGWHLFLRMPCCCTIVAATPCFHHLCVHMLLPQHLKMRPA